MPIYLDRHDAPDHVTAEHVAEMHIADLACQDQFGCKGFTYWFDEKRHAGFCLIEAPNREAIEKMHDHAHGDIPAQIIEVEKEFDVDNPVIVAEKPTQVLPLTVGCGPGKQSVQFQCGYYLIE